jgi:hypothetical protein
MSGGRKKGGINPLSKKITIQRSEIIKKLHQKKFLP